MKRQFEGREISPVLGMSADDFWHVLAPPVRALVTTIRRQKTANQRRRPSTSLLDESNLLTRDARVSLVDGVAALVDENLCGRSEMCIQFAELLSRALRELRQPAIAFLGIAHYQGSNGKWFQWEHAWVVVGEELIDGNLDSLDENPIVPNSIRPRPYWGPISEMPCERRYEPRTPLVTGADPDVETIWWPELRRVLPTQE